MIKLYTRFWVALISMSVVGLALADQTYQDCPSCPEMVLLPAGNVVMGTINLDPKVAAARAERETSSQSVHAFAIGRFEVTAAQWQAYLNDEPFEERRLCYQWLTQSERFVERDVPTVTGLDLPISCVNFNEVNGYLQWLSRKTGKTYRLPSEAEWEYAAKAGAVTTFPWGDDAIDGCEYANLYDQSAQESHSMGYKAVGCHDGFVTAAPVGSFHANAFGVFDMLGNVAEWTADCYTESFVGRPTGGRAWVWSGGCTAHVVKGGGYYSPSELARPGMRLAVGNRERYETIGFRVASDALSSGNPNKSAPRQ